ncbi:hypothetical protein [Dyadobacter frigoris]|uniref:Cytochrome B n=1 Tax=Dyadobacter frigoris TaxID=2576211 RepID=A0A4U6CZK2_9BACT|nr:hypothetical protein [Dyadobacter frigoris]TKT90310.1 hypothetical protein FDK13_21470 [Dyadobacter frigoris]GLU52546.1 hypothetical protein Dfri01_20070 [Dyadobacter frigoris]
MYSYLLFFHSIFRWLVLLSLLYAIFRGIRGRSGKLSFSKSDDSVRHIIATISHVQLTIGYLLYFNSPFIAYFRSHYHEAIKQFDFMFFGMIHITLMTISIILITIGSSAAKRQETDEDKFRTMTVYFAIALLIIFMAIPWPFSPLANRPYLRSF